MAPSGFFFKKLVKKLKKVFSRINRIIKKVRGFFFRAIGRIAGKIDPTLRSILIATACAGNAVCYIAWSAQINAAIAYANTGSFNQAFKAGAIAGVRAAFEVATGNMPQPLEFNQGPDVIMNFGTAAKEAERALAEEIGRQVAKGAIAHLIGGEEKAQARREEGDAQQEDWTENWFAKGNHRYSRVSPAVCPALECSQAQVVNALNRRGVHPNQTTAFVPGEPYTADVNIPGPFGRDGISTTAVYSDGVQIGIRNQTLENHALHPGVVERTVILQNGSFHIQTQGGGYGRWGGPNIWFDDAVWGPVDQSVIGGVR